MKVILVIYFIVACLSLLGTMLVLFAINKSCKYIESLHPYIAAILGEIPGSVAVIVCLEIFEALYIFNTLHN